MDAVNLGCGCLPTYNEPLEWEIPFKLTQTTELETNEFDFNPCYLKNKVICEYNKILDLLECGILPSLDILMEELSLLTINSYYRKEPNIDVKVTLAESFTLIKVNCDREVEEAKIINLTKSKILREAIDKEFSWLGLLDDKDEILIKVKAKNGLSSFKKMTINLMNKDKISDEEVTFTINEANYGLFISVKPNLGLTLGGFEVALNKQQINNSGIVYYVYTTVEQIRPGKWTFKIIEL